MVPYKVEMKVHVTDVNGRDMRIPLAKNIPSVDPMKMAGTRVWASRNFNKLLKTVQHDHIVSATFWAQQIRSPYTSMSGALSGVNGREMRRVGIFERW